MSSARDDFSFSDLGKVFQIWFYLNQIDGLSIFFSVYFQYKFTEKIYLKLFCCCDCCCHGILALCIKIRANKSTKNEKVLSDILENDRNDRNNRNE